MADLKTYTKDLNGLIALGKDQNGYMEKANAQFLDEHKKNAGYGNFQKFSRDINESGLKGYQGSAWCITFQFWLDLKTFGKEKALKLWNMTVSDYVGYNCFATYNKFASKGKVGKTPKLGSLVIFTYSHAGRVINIYKKNGVEYFDCLEGNTSDTTLDERNGGCVAIKTRRADSSVIKGFCYIDYDSVEEKEDTLSGWVQTNKGWKFYLGDTGKPVVNAWYMDTTGKWSFFNGEGIAESDTWIEYNGDWYYLGSDCYCLESEWIKYKDKWYYISADGTMARNANIHSKDAGNDVYYWVDDDGVWDRKTYATPREYPVVI